MLHYELDQWRLAMNKMIYVLLFLVVVLVVVISWMLHRSTVQQGEQLAIENCSDCHDLTQQRANEKGPYLWSIVNRRAGSVSGFRYSEAFREFANASKFSWSEANLDAFIADPDSLIPGTKMAELNGDSEHAMAFVGMDQLDHRRQLIVYLRTLK